MDSEQGKFILCVGTGNAVVVPYHFDDLFFSCVLTTRILNDLRLYREERRFSKCWLHEYRQFSRELFVRLRVIILRHGLPPRPVEIVKNLLSRY